MRKMRKRTGAAAARPKRAKGGTASNVVPLRVTEDARRWIAENLMLGHPPERVVEQLRARGCTEALAAAEIERAIAHPYYQGARILQQRLAKRDWLLGNLGRLAAVDGGLDRVPIVEAPSAETFFADFYAAHRPVLISGLIEHWPATRLWSLDHFDATLGDAEIEVQTGRESNANYEIESPRHRQRMPLSRVIAWLREDPETNDFYVTANNGGHNRTALARLWEEIGPIPGYLDPDGDRDGFFWMGPRGTVTPFHHDLTNNLLIQIRGRKRVTLVPSWDTPKMNNARHCFSDWSGPEAVAALPDGERPAMLTCTIEPGQALFIPVGWWHHVVGLDVTIGMSFTNFIRPNDYWEGYTTYDQV